MTTESIAQTQYVANIPLIFKERHRWTPMQLIRQPGGKLKKVPIVAGVKPNRKSGEHLAKVDDPSTWSDYNTTLSSAQMRGMGVAYVFGPERPEFFIDIDNCIQSDGTVRPDAWALIEALGTYTEISPSGDGIHIYGVGTIPEGSAPPITPLETYPKKGGRFCVMTGNVVPGYEELRECQDQLNATFLPRRKKPRNGTTTSAAYTQQPGELTPEERTASLTAAKAVYVTGIKHPFTLAYSGLMAKAGVTREQAIGMIRELAADDNDPPAKESACSDTFDVHASGSEVSGYQYLLDVCGLSEEQVEAIVAPINRFRIRNAPPPPEPPPNVHVRRTPPPINEILEERPPDFPLEILPPALRVYVEQAAAAIPIAPEVIAMPMLSQAGSVIGNRRVLKMKGTWDIYPSTYVVVVARPGSSKSAGLDLAARPLTALQAEARAQFKTDLEKYEQDLSSWEMSPKSGRSPKPTLPTMRHFFSTDATMEKLARMLAQSPGVCLTVDEIVGWTERMDQYRKGGDREHYMSMWGSAPLKVDRVTDEATIWVERPVLSVVGSTQPQVVPFLHTRKNVDSGWIQRLIPIVPFTQPKVWNDNDLSPGAKQDVLALYRALSQLGLGQDLQARPVGLSPAAIRVWAPWSNALNAQAHRDTTMYGSYLLKTEAHVARFALILHILSDPFRHSATISAETIESACVLGEWMMEHIRRMIPLLGHETEHTSGQMSPWLKVRRFLERARHKSEKDRSLDSSKGIPHFSTEGWVSKTDLLRGVHLTTEELTIELDTHIDLGEIESRTIQDVTKPKTEYRLVKDADEKNWEIPFEQSNDLTIGNNVVALRTNRS